MPVQPTQKYHHTRHQVQLRRDLYGSPPIPRFMGLPIEVRVMIYRRVFGGLKLHSCSARLCYPRVPANSSVCDKKSLAILCVNKQINQEACALLLQKCDLYLLNRYLEVFHWRHSDCGRRPRLGQAMYQEIRTIWITTEHIRSWNRHGGLTSLRNFRLINIEHNRGGVKRELFQYLSCVPNHGRDPWSFVSIQERRSLVDLSVERTVGPDDEFVNERTTPKLRPIIAKNNENPDQLRIHVHLRCPPCTCLRHCWTQRGWLISPFAITKRLTLEYDWDTQAVLDLRWDNIQ